MFKRTRTKILVVGMSQQLTIPFRENKVVKHNLFVEASYDWTSQMHRIVMMLVAQISKADKRFQMQRIYLQDIIQLTDVKGNGIYEELEKACEALRTQYITIREEGKGDWRRRNLMSEVAYRGSKGYIEAKFNDDMRELLLELKGYFTQYRLFQVMPLRSPYSIRFYELCSRWRDVKFFDIDIAELRRLLGLQDKYERVYDLKTYVLDAARQELKEKTDLYFDYREVRAGRRLVRLKFHVIEQASRSTVQPPVVLKAPSTQGEPQRAEEEEREQRVETAFRKYLEALTDEERHGLYEEAREIVVRRYPGLEEWNEAPRESMIYTGMMDLWREREDVSDEVTAG